MMDWGLIISALTGLVAGGGASWVLFYRQSKSGATSDAITKSAEAMEKLLDNVKKQQEIFNGIITQKDLTIEQQAKLLDEYKCSLEKSNQKIKQFEYLVKESERKLDGIQKKLNTEMSERKKAEGNICFVEDCQLRRPPKNTYNKESA